MRRRSLSNRRTAVFRFSRIFFSWLFFRGVSVFMQGALEIMIQENPVVALPT
jgi:hypothetical protein